MYTGKARVYLAKKGLLGKVHLTSDMDENDTSREICSVFKKCIQEKEQQFSFSVLHPIGGGSKNLTLPNVSATFAWTAKEVAKAAGKGAIYIWAQEDLRLPNNDEVVISDTEVESDDNWM